MCTVKKQLGKARPSQHEGHVLESHFGHGCYLSSQLKMSTEANKSIDSAANSNIDENNYQRTSKSEKLIYNFINLEMTKNSNFKIFLWSTLNFIKIVQLVNSAVKYKK